MERYWPSLLALQAMGERLDMVGFWALSESVFYACHPASCSWTFAKPTVFPSHCANLSKNIAPWQPEPQAAFMGEEGDSYPEPLGPSICLALQPRHLLTAIVRLCQMTGQDPHGEPWSTLMHSYVCMHAHTHTRVYMCLLLPSRATQRPSAGSGHCLCAVGRRWKQKWPGNTQGALVPSQQTCLTDLQPQLQLFSSGSGLQSHRLQKIFRHAGQRCAPLFTSEGPSEYINQKTHLHAQRCGVEMHSLSRWLIEFVSYWH